LPARKLSQADLDDLRAADDELLRSSHPRRITRDDTPITTQAGIAAWKGISESHYHALKRSGWKLKRGVPFDERSTNGDMVPASVLKATFEMMLDRIEAQSRRIDELETQLREKDQP